jgi:hypothetical protein
MTMAITSWLRGYFATRERTAELRGLAEIDAGTSQRSAWPRTTGSDVITIAALVDPALRAYPLRWGGHGIGRRWRACVDDLERFARCAPYDEYPPNPSFWSALAAACVYLHASQAPLPEQPIWSALLERLGSQPDGGTMISKPVESVRDSRDPTLRSESAARFVAIELAPSDADLGQSPSRRCHGTGLAT